MNLLGRLILPADVFIVSQQSFTSDVIHQSETVRHLGSIRKEEEDGQTDRQTDGRTDRITISLSRVSSSMLTRDKNSPV